MPLHRIQLDIDVVADTHEEAVAKIQDWIAKLPYAPDMKDHLVLEENEECCHTCTPTILKPTYWSRIGY